jgi:hypothetical protein
MTKAALHAPHRFCRKTTSPRSAIPVARWGWTRTTVHGRVRPSGPNSDGYLLEVAKLGSRRLQRWDPRVVFSTFQNNLHYSIEFVGNDCRGDVRLRKSQISLSFAEESHRI